MGVETSSSLPFQVCHHPSSSPVFITSCLHRDKSIPLVSRSTEADRSHTEIRLTPSSQTIHMNINSSIDFGTWCNVIVSSV